MVRHIVLWRLKPQAKSAGAIPAMAQIERAIAAARTGVPGILRLEIGADQVHGGDSSDLLLLGEFDSWESLRGYERHALHDELRGLIGPLRDERRVVDYEL